MPPIIKPKLGFFFLDANKIYKTYFSPRLNPQLGNFTFEMSQTLRLNCRGAPVEIITFRYFIVQSNVHGEKRMCVLYYVISKKSLL